MELWELLRNDLGFEEGRLASVLGQPCVTNIDAADFIGGNISSHTWNTAIQGALGLLNAAKVPGFYTGTHFAYPAGMTRLSWPGWLVKTERVGTGFKPIPSQY